MAGEAMARKRTEESYEEEKDEEEGEEDVKWLFFRIFRISGFKLESEVG